MAIRQFSFMSHVVGFFVAMTLFTPAVAGDKSDATPSRPAQLTVAVPEGDQAQKVLDVAVEKVVAPSSGSLGGVVRIGALGSPESIEVGRFSVFPVETSAEKKTYRFDVTSALQKLDAPTEHVVVSVDVVDRLHRTPGNAAKLVLGPAQIINR